MTDTQTGSSLTQHARLFDTGAHVLSAAFLDGAPALALVDGVVLIGEPDAQRRVVAHPDASILTATSDGKTLLTGGDDGRVVAVRADGGLEDIADEKGRWIDALALRGKVYAWSVGKQVRARDESGIVKIWSAPTTARGLAFQPKGFRVAATHYNGATLWFPKIEGTPQTLEWKGAHLDATFSPDGRFLVTSMQENALHGWRLSDNQHMRMSGYPAKTESLSFTRNGKWLASSGADAMVLWPFFGGGPMGKAPIELAGGDGIVCTQVASHPLQEMVAGGFADGLLVLADIDTSRILPVAPPEHGAISALAWSPNGTQLAFGTESGFAAIIDLSKR